MSLRQPGYSMSSAGNGSGSTATRSSLRQTPIGETAPARPTDGRRATVATVMLVCLRLVYPLQGPFDKPRFLGQRFRGRRRPLPVHVQPAPELVGGRTPLLPRFLRDLCGHLSQHLAERLALLGALPLEL